MARLCNGQTAALWLNSIATPSKGVLSHCRLPAAGGLTTKREKSDLTAYKRGSGGRSSFNGVVATVFGASGFLGRYVVNQLGKMGSQVVIPYRGTEYDVDHLKLCGDLGQILYSPYNLKDEDSIRKAVQYSNVVINLVGREWSTRNFSLEDVNVTGPETIARIAAEQGVEKLVHLSAMNAANPEYTLFNQASKYIISKGQGEQAVRAQFPDAVIMRPADMWGDEDRFFRYWAGNYRRHFECMPLWQKGENTVKQPVDVVNVAQGIIKAVTEKGTNGATFECVGPKSYYLYDMIEYFFDEMRFGHIPIIPMVPTFLAKVKVSEKIFPSTPPLSMEKLIREAATDRLTGCPTLEDLGVRLSTLEDGARYQLKVQRRSRDYDESLHEVSDAPPPMTAAEVDESKKVYF